MSRESQIRDVQAAYPGWLGFCCPEGTRLQGYLRVEDRAGLRNIFKVEVTIPREFPSQNAHPQARILSHDLTRSLGADAHVQIDGTMCVQMQERNEIDYQRGGLLLFMQQVELHLRRARIWSLTGKYPGPQYLHGESGRREYLAELPALRARFEAIAEEVPASVRHLTYPGVPVPRDRARCPCGSGRRFSHCHKATVLQARDRMRALGPQPERLVPTGRGPLMAALRQLGRNRRRR